MESSVCPCKNLTSPYFLAYASEVRGRCYFCRLEVFAKSRNTTRRIARRIDRIRKIYIRFMQRVITDAYYTIK